MGKILTGFLGLAFVIFLIWLLVWKFIIDTGQDIYEEKSEPLKELVGEQVLINGDTLEVVNYNTLNQTVTLDNDVKIDAELARSKVIE